jgi:hypothetical protein
LNPRGKWCRKPLAVWKRLDEEESVAAEKNKKTCKIKGCKRPYRAKGYCNVHYRKWRKGELERSRYQTCNFGVNKLKRGEKKECLKPVFRAGLCEEHFQASFKKKRAAKEHEAAAEAEAEAKAEA